MDADIKNIRKLVKLMRSEGVLRVKTPQIEIEIAPASIQVKKPKIDSSEPQAIATDEQYSPESVLFWSAPGMPAEAEEAA